VEEVREHKWPHRRLLVGCVPQSEGYPGSPGFPSSASRTCAVALFLKRWAIPLSWSLIMVSLMLERVHQQAFLNVVDLKDFL
jgi:hypothetical protein